ncbi:MAG TPA: LytTR family DNA-binding domain-containing protein [Pseudosphingobacterium sp.]|nr:LytTR family DNA-binding domain-containing protein [Pseudosphingobacterium sp.]
MNKISVLIVDADDTQRTLICESMRLFPSFYVSGACSNGLEAVKYINARAPQLLFIDTDLPGQNAFKVLANVDHVPPVIFTSRTEVHAIKAFEHNAIDYLLKPYNMDRLHLALEKYLKWYDITLMNGNLLFSLAKNELPTRILVENGRRLQSIAIHDITYFKAERDYTWIYTLDNHSYLSSFGIGSIERKLDNRFIRIHRSYIVNVEHIMTLYKDISKLFVTLPNDVEINVGRNYLSAIKQLIF